MKPPAPVPTPSSKGRGAGVERRSVLLECLQAALAAVDARRCVRTSLVESPASGAWQVVAVGKAAGAMTLGAADVLGTRLRGGVVVAPVGHFPDELAVVAPQLRLTASSHPVPDERSVAAGEAVVQFVAALPRDAQLLFLVSGGASALLEQPRAGVSLGDLVRVNRWALESGAPIMAVNAVRRRLSCLKGGGLAVLAGGRRALALMISDVPGDDPRVIGSGLLHAPGPEDALDAHSLPAEVRRVLELAPAGAGAAARRVPTRMVATLGMAFAAAAARAASLGFVARRGRSRLTGDAAELGRRLACRAARLPDRTLAIHGGESTVTLPARPGRGGRNQHLALAAALAFEDSGAGDVCLLAAGTDGVDGASDDAGGIVDAGTCRRGREGGFDPHVSLAAADSGSFLEAAGDLLHTGATLTNVGDLVLALKSGEGVA